MVDMVIALTESPIPTEGIRKFQRLLIQKITM